MSFRCSLVRLLNQQFWHSAKCCNFLNGWDQNKQQLETAFCPEMSLLVTLELNLTHLQCKIEWTISQKMSPCHNF